MYNKTSTMKAVRSQFTDDQVAAFIRLFKIAPASAQSSRLTSAEDALTNGLLFVDNQGNILSNIPQTAYRYANEFYGNHTRLFNETFYKSFSTVRDSSPYVLLFDQLMHYMTTYGAESMGIKVPTYVPLQALELPENQYNKDFKVTVIQILPDEACFARLNAYLKTLTAPSPQIVECVTELLQFITIPTDDIKSFEIQVIKHKEDGTVPNNPVSQLRYIVYCTTGQTLIIKNRAMRESIKRSSYASSPLAYNLFIKCDITGLASIFLRYKPIFLAFKGHNQCAPFINFLRRKADQYHRPLANESLQNLTAITDPKAQAAILAKASNRELIKVLNSINSRLSLNESAPGVYAVRNGRTFVKEDGLEPNHRLRPIASLITRTLVSRLVPVLSGKTFYLPSYINYAVPTSEKQFIGNIPFGTRIMGTPNGAFTIGVHWFNQKDHRVDIDLHMNSATQHFGWNAGYRSGDQILYTGDQTNAPEPNGAAEAFWFSPNGDTYIVGANLYSGPQDTEYKLFMTEKKPGTTTVRGQQNNLYTYNPNEALFPAIPLKFCKEDSDMNIGMFADNIFFFYGGSVGHGIVPTANYEQFIRGLTAQLKTKTQLKYLLMLCGATVLDDDTIAPLTAEELVGVISLAPEDITTDTLLNIVDGTL